MEEEDLQKCTSCLIEFDSDRIGAQDRGENWFCPSCWAELADVMEADYQEMIANGEIELED